MTACRALTTAGVLVVGVLLGFGERTAGAEKAVHPEERLRIATDVVVGEVTDVYSKVVTTERFGKGTTERRYLYEVRIGQVEKGDLRPADVLYVRAWRVQSTPVGASTFGMWGHVLPEPKDRVRVFAVRGPYKDGNQADNGYSAVYASGFEVLPGEGR